MSNDINTNSLIRMKPDALAVIADVLNAKTEDITDIMILKNGMTNRSFFFQCHGEKYIIRTPGEGTDQIINRQQEAMVYKVISGLGICDDNLYINPENGYKITRYIENFRVCDPLNREDVIKCMEKLRGFHDRKLTVDHEFDIFAHIDFYESLWQGKESAYPDHAETKKKALKLKQYIDAHVDTKVLCHIDAVSDNFLIYKDEQGNEKVSLIDWEYAGMQDPHADIAMFAVYSFYDRKQIDDLIDIYFENNCADEIRVKIYCYVAVCGMLWSNWAEYKRNMGVDFGEYSIRQYRYASEFYDIVRETLGEKRKEWGIE